MRKQKTVILGVIFLLLTSIFAMSDDGANEPKVEIKENINEVSQVVNSNLTEKTKSIETVKDRLGIDTGLTKKELEEFKKQYMKKAKEIGILEHKSISPESYFKHKINLNAVNELKKLGLFLTHTITSSEERFAYNIAHSDVIVIGTLDSYEYLYKTRAEELEAQTRSRYFVKVEEILKGKEYYKSNPNQISFLSSIGKHIISSGEHQLKIGQKYIFFFQTRPSVKEKLRSDFIKLRNSLRIEDTELYYEYNDNIFEKSFDEVLSLIDKFIELNDIGNFYNNKYIYKEVNNEK